MVKAPSARRRPSGSRGVPASFYEAGAVKVELPDEPNTTEMFITVPDLVPKKLMEFIVRGRLHEFWEEEPNARAGEYVIPFCRCVSEFLICWTGAYP